MKWLVAVLVLGIVFVVGLAVFLQPNNFIGCNASPDTSQKCSKADAIIVVSGGDTQARTNAGVELYKNGWADRIIFSGAAQDKTGPSNAEVMELQAIQSGVPTSAIMIDKEAASTKQNADNTREILTKNELTDVILVTSGYHQRRASLEFGRLANDLNVRNYPVAHDRDWSWYWWTTQRGWWLAGGEAVKILVFFTETV